MTTEGDRQFLDRTTGELSAMFDVEHVPKALLVNARDTAHALSICERTLWGLTKCGEIPCIRIGRAVRYAPQDLTAYIDRQRGGQ